MVLPAHIFREASPEDVETATSFLPEPWLGSDMRTTVARGTVWAIATYPVCIEIVGSLRAVDALEVAPAVYCHLVLPSRNSAVRALSRNYSHGDCPSYVKFEFVVVSENPAMGNHSVCPLAVCNAGVKLDHLVLRRACITQVAQESWAMR